ncbi:uncharacterized protein LTR77_005494 [Saxophila tyrrhenica]|uniref:PHD-type domain-containing protein n=1 Tax=Saxophila tyrrhenica TaxID=1690608 RepID=A0AAV9P9E5_9PEZI|nr:hypothetical protein LTR77_005494 [Saxophila tyrrhenica]
MFRKDTLRNAYRPKRKLQEQAFLSARLPLPGGMEEPIQNQPSAGEREDVVQTEAASSQAPPSTSVLSDAPMTDALEAPNRSASLPKDGVTDSATPSSFQEPQYSANTESILKRINDNAANAAASGTPGWEAAKEQIMKDMATSDKFPTPTPPRETPAPKRGGRGGKRTSLLTDGDTIAVKMEGNGATTTPTTTGRGRGRGGGRPRGRGRGGGRGGKRKREEGEGDDSEDSEIYSPAVTMTKSGRSIQKPTSFVPPPPSPTGTNKRKRPYRRNPESAVCKVCLRGTSPASNMIVFCDGCNTPYHRYCHHPPIHQAVVDEVDKEWYCKQCEKKRVVPVPEAEVSSFVSAPGASVEQVGVLVSVLFSIGELTHMQRQRYFGSLPPGMLVTLLTKATTLHPELPVFAPDFQARATATENTAIPAAQPEVASNGHAHPPSMTQTSSMGAPNPAPNPAPRQSFQATAGAPNYQSNFMSAPTNDFVPEGHPPNYPRPGHGLMRTLPPEQEDLQWLVEDDDRYGAFSHYYQANPSAANASLNGGNGNMP